MGLKWCDHESKCNQLINLFVCFKGLFLPSNSGVVKRNLVISRFRNLVRDGIVSRNLFSAIGILYKINITFVV